MNIRNAWGFLSFGLVMGLLPLIAPSWFPPTGLDGSSARAMWLELMGMVQTGLGGGRMFREFALPAFIRWLTFTPSEPTIAPVLAFEREREQAMPSQPMASSLAAVTGEAEAA